MLSTTVKKMMLMGIGALSLTRERAEILVKELTEKGDVNQTEARSFVAELIQRGEQERKALQKAVRGEMARLRDEFSMVNKKDLARLEARLRRIEKHLNLPPLAAEGADSASQAEERLQRIEDHLNLTESSPVEVGEQRQTDEAKQPG
jgi:polyhydroxyalkanoate synthesis regulator phasin